jgi:hypothetical protein
MKGNIFSFNTKNVFPPRSLFFSLYLSRVIHKKERADGHAWQEEVAADGQ